VFARLFRVLAISVAMCCAGLVSAEPTEKPAITEVIQSQLDAFARDDFETAFTFASPIIQGLFGTPDRFGGMVVRGYPMVHRANKVDFLDLRNIAGAYFQQVRVRDVQGRTHVLEYQMQRFGSVWKINGVRLLKVNELSA